MREHPHAPWLAVAAVCIGAFMGQLDASIVTVALPSNESGKLQTLRSQLIASPQIKDVSFSFNSPSAESNWMQGIQYRKGAEPIEIRTQMKMVDAHFLNTYGIQLLAGWFGARHQEEDQAE